MRIRIGQWPELPGLDWQSFLGGPAAARRAATLVSSPAGVMSSPAGVMSAYGDIRNPVGWTGTGRTVTGREFRDAAVPAIACSVYASPSPTRPRLLRTTAAAFAITVASLATAACGEDDG